MYLKIQQYIRKIFLAASLAVFFPMLYQTLVYTIQTYNKRIGDIIYFAVEISAGLYLLFIIPKLIDINQEIYTALLVTLAMILRLYWIYKVQTPPESDFKTMLDAAVGFSKGIINFGYGNTYFSVWGYQIGYTLYQGFILVLTGSVNAIKVINAAYSAGTVILIYKISSRLVCEKAARSAGILAAVYPPGIVMLSVLTNQHMATFFFYLAFYSFLFYSKNKLRSGYVTGALIAISNLIRPMAPLAFLTIILFILLTEKGREIISRTGNLIRIIAVFLVISQLAGALVVHFGISPYPMTNRDPLWKFVTGLNHESGGMISGKDSSYLSHFGYGPERKEAELDLIRERTSDLKSLIALFKEKFKRMWIHEDECVDWAIDSIPDLKSWKETAYITERLMFIMLVLFCSIGIIKGLFRKSTGEGFFLSF